MPDYQNGKIYTIRSYQTEEIYIGSTTQGLAARLGSHRRDYNSYKNSKHHYVTSFKLIELEDHYVELLEMYPCDSKEQLLKREGQCIRAAENCVNRCIAGRTKREYYQDNADHIREVNKQYQVANADHIREVVREYQKNNADHLKQYQKQYRQENKEARKKYEEDHADRINATRRNRYEANKDRINKDRRKRYAANYQANKEAINAARRANRAAKKAAANTISSSETED